MKVVPLESSSITQLPNAKVEPQISARERAIKILMQQQNEPANRAIQTETQTVPEKTPVTAAAQTQELRQTDNSEVPSDQTPQPAAETKVEAAKPEEPISSQYAVLARKEKALRQRELQLKAREAALKAQEAPKAVTPPPLAFDESKYISREELEKDTLGTLANKLGISYEKLAEDAVNAPSPEQIAFNAKFRAMEAELEKLRNEQESTKKTFEERDNESYKQAVRQIRNEAVELISSDPEFETIRETNSVDDVVELIEAKFKQDGVVLSVEDAAKEVETYLVDEALKIAKIKKIQQRLSPAAKPAEQKTTDTSKQPQMKTLTNAVSSSRPLSARERAVLAFEGKLQK